MSNAAAHSATRNALADAIAQAALPDAVMANAQRLLTRLDTPVRVTLLGLPGSGKSTLMNLLVGETVVPERARLPTTQLIHGARSQAQLTMPDGATVSHDIFDPYHIARLSPLFVQISLPLPALSKISILEVVMSEDRVEQTRATLWAAKRTDIALWCTDTFTTSEQLLWQDMPDRIKDNGFLLVTKMDLLDDPDARADRMQQVQDLALDQFANILPIATIQAVAARGADGSIDKGQLRASGATALISAILRQVEMGRQAVVDQADILLRTHGVGPAMDRPSVADIDPKPVAVAPEKAEPRRDPEPAKSEPEVVRIIEPQPTATAPEIVETNVVPLRPSDAARAVFDPAIERLAQFGRNLSQADDITPKKIMAQSVKTVQWLSDHLSENGPQDDPVLAQARDAALDAADLAQLMQIEDRDSATIEAVSLMIQLKRNLQADMAA